MAEAASSVTIVPALKDHGYLNAHHELPPSSERKPSDDLNRDLCCVCEGFCKLVYTSFKPSTNIQIHTFVGAAVSYFRFEEHGQVECALIGAKNHVASLKYISIPCLEFQAAVVGFRLTNSIQRGRSYAVSRHYFWTDARDVICWLKSVHRTNERINELLEATELSEWRWVPSRLNVADEATKWKRAPSLDLESHWFKASKFLWQPEDYWPESRMLGNTQNELRSKLLHHTNTDKCIVTLADYARWKTLLHATAHALRISKDTEIVRNSESAPLTREELYEAANYLCTQAQEDVYPDERMLLAIPEQNSNKKILPKRSPLYKLEPFIDDKGVMHLRGRLDACDFIDETRKYPVILPRQHLVTQLIVQQIHEDFHHQCHQAVLNEIRSKFYIPRLRVVYSKVRRSCQECKVMMAKPEPPRMALGCFELARTLTTSSCIMSLRNIISRRGVSVEINSDRGTNLVGASKEIKKALEEVDDSGTALRVAWKSSQMLANIFWKRWIAEYLPENTRRSKWFKPVRPIQIGDLVIIVESLPRNCWPRGRVIATKLSKDGQVRSATVRTDSGVSSDPW